MTTSVSAMGSREKTAKMVGNTPRIHGAFEIAECVLTSAAWSLAAKDEEKKCCHILYSAGYKPSCSYQKITFQLCYVSSNEKFRAAPNEKEVKINWLTKVDSIKRKKLTRLREGCSVLD